MATARSGKEFDSNSGIQQQYTQSAHHKHNSITNMSPKDMSFAKAFDELLPLEIKQMIFKWAASDNSSDIQIRLLHDNEGQLHAPAVDLLTKLKDQYSTKAYHQAVEYLTGSMFRWTFNSDTQPHRYLLRAFRNSVPMEVRQRIKHAYLPRVTVYGLINPATRSTSFKNLRMPNPSVPEPYSDYFTRLGATPFLDWVVLIIQIKKDNAGGMQLLPIALPSLKKLDLGLDILDCLERKPELMTDDTFVRSEDWMYLLQCSPLSGGFGALANLTEIANLDIRVIWYDFLDKKRNFPGFSGEIEKKAHVFLMETFCLSLPAAKSIVGHSDSSSV